MGNYNSELYHYGVPGMKWGVRKSVREAYNRSRANSYTKTARYNKFKARKSKISADVSRKRMDKFNQKIADLFDARCNKLDKKAQKAVIKGESYIKKLSSDMSMVSIRTQHKLTANGIYTFIGPKFVKLKD